MAQKTNLKNNEKTMMLAKTIDELIKSYLKKICGPSYDLTMGEFLKLVELQRTLTPEHKKATHLTVGWCDRVIVPEDGD
jgi:hypothetical protein